MRFFIFLLVSGHLFAAKLELNPIRSLEPVPEDSEYFLQLPSSFALDPEGNYYLADLLGRIVFSWDAEGRFRRAIGKPGNGPGEFSFFSTGGPQAYLGVAEDKLFVYDGGKRAILAFDFEGNFIESKTLNLQAGRTQSFHVTPKNQFVVHHSSFMRENPVIEVALLNAAGEQIKILKSIEDDTFERKSDGRNVQGVVIKGYSPRLVTSLNAKDGEIVLGYTGEPSFEVFDLAGNLKSKVTLTLPRQDVTREDTDEFDQLPWIKNNSFFSAKYPEKLPFYDRVLPVGDRGFLVFSESPFYHRIRGVLVNTAGKTLGRVEMKCGENGTLLGANDRILAVRTDDEGNYILQEVTIDDRT